MKTQPNLYAFIGFKLSGKSTAAKYYESKGFTRLNFKDALVKEMKDNFPDLLQEIGDVETKYDRGFADQIETVDDLFTYKPPLMRALMQNYGTDVRRKDNDNYWTDKWGMAYAALHPTDVVVDDVRFLNEAAEIKKYGGKIIRIVRSDITSGGDHVSETEHLEIKADYTVEVEPGDHNGLERKLEEIYQSNK